MANNAQVAFAYIGYVIQSGAVHVVDNRLGVTTWNVTPTGSSQSSGSASPAVLAQPQGQSVTSGAGGSGKRPFARVTTNCNIYFSVGPNPNALTDAGAMYLPAGGVEYVACNPGDAVAIVTGN
jgi:hypothetical protein